MARSIERGALAAVVAAIFATPALAARIHPKVVNFPGDGVREVVSPTGVAIYFIDQTPDGDGNSDRPILLRYPGGRTEQIDSFGRNADVSWSPHGDWLVVTNNLGSDVADCRAITPGAPKAHTQSLTSLIEGGRFPRISAEVRNADHAYVRCGRWLSPDGVEVRVEGNVCNPIPCRMRWFDYRLTYDFRSGRLSSGHRR